MDEGKPQGAKSAWLVRDLLPHEPWLRNYLILSSCPLADVDDVVQDCFLKIHAAVSIERAVSPRGLLRHVARNVLIDRHRRWRGIEFVGLDAALEVPSDCCPQDELFDLRRTLTRVALAIDAFPARRRDIVERRCIAGQSSRDAAADLGLCSSAVDKQLRKSLEVLRSARDGACGEYVQA